MESYAKRILLPALVIAALGAGVAHGKECKGVNFPDQVQVEGASLTLNGLGLRQATAFKSMSTLRLVRCQDLERREGLAGSEYAERTRPPVRAQRRCDDLRRAGAKGFEKNSRTSCLR